MRALAIGAKKGQKRAKKGIFGGFWGVFEGFWRLKTEVLKPIKSNQSIEKDLGLGHGFFDFFEFFKKNCNPCTGVYI